MEEAPLPTLGIQFCGLPKDWTQNPKSRETREGETADDGDDCILNVNNNFKILAFYLKFKKIIIKWHVRSFKM